MNFVGFQVIERHFTLDKQQKGTDHQLSLEPIEFEHLIKKIRCIEEKQITMDDGENEKILSFLSELVTDSELKEVQLALSPVDCKKILDCEIPCRLKLGKSLVYRMPLQCGTKLSENMICSKVSEPFGIPAERFDEFIGRMIHTNVESDDNIHETHFI